jgi:hypothetical protein
VVKNGTVKHGLEGGGGRNLSLLNILKDIKIEERPYLKLKALFVYNYFSPLNALWS